MKKYLKIIAVLGSLGLIAGIFVFVFVVNKSHPDYEHKKPDFTLTVSELYSTYQNDNVKGSATYDGKVVQVSGALSAVESSGNDTYVCFVLNEGMFGAEGVRVRMLENQKKPSQKLEPGQAVAIKGFVTGYNETDVVLEHGSIVQ
ncbi:MAG: hypothetical protein FD155_686 [Bacteroidetes bacterium]|nr:MAG: hypothetical protein FD155_686 [Bacteroidota bacterium]